MRTNLLIGILVIILCGVAGVVNAQEQAVSDDEVNEIAGKLYCPVCENIPLDVCGTSACSDWRYEIRIQLEKGMTDQEIIDDFVHRFGDRVVGTPQDPTLRVLSLATPYVALIIGFILTLITLFKLRTQQPQILTTLQNVENNADTAKQADRYRDLLEQDLS